MAMYFAMTHNNKNKWLQTTVFCPLKQWQFSTLIILSKSRLRYHSMKIIALSIETNNSNGRRREIVTYFFDKCTLLSLRKVCIWSLDRLIKSVPFNQKGYNQNAPRLSTFASTSRSASSALTPHCSLLGLRADVDSATNLFQWCILLQSHRGYSTMVLHLKSRLDGKYSEKLHTRNLLNSCVSLVSQVIISTM